MDAPSSNSRTAEASVKAGAAPSNRFLTNNPLTSPTRAGSGIASNNNPSQLNPSKSPTTANPGTGISKGKSSKTQPDLAADVNAILADYDNILSRMEQENADLLAAARRLAASRKNMTRAFDDVAKARQRMSAVFDKARAAASATAPPYPSPAPASPYGSTDNDGGRASGHKRTPSELSRLDLERKRWDVMKRYEELYRERKAVDAQVALMREKGAKDAEWVQGMFFRVAEKGLFEAAVVREKKRRPVVLDDEGEEAEY